MRALLPAFLLLSITACGGAEPCGTCPPVDGTYAVTWTNPTPPAGCATTAPRVATWTLTQMGTQVESVIAGVRVGGTLYDTSNLVLSGGTGSLTYRLRTLVRPTGGGDDAGVTLEGTFTTQTPADGGTFCEAKEAFTAQRTSR